MPLRKVSSVTERAGINYLRNLVEANNSIFKEMNQQHDYGHDAFVLLVEGEQVLPKEVKFVRTDLPGISLRSTDLTDVCFHDCVLADCKFEWAHLIGTRFEKLGNDALRGAQFGALEHFEYIYNDNQLIEDRDQMRKWALEHTGIVAEQADPCATAFQFRTVFRKFVHEDGSGRRDQLPRAALMKGKIHTGGATAKDCVDACIRYEYLTPPNFRDYIKRVPGKQYDEVVDFVRDWRLSPRLKSMMDELCPIKNCPHVPDHSVRGPLSNGLTPQRQ